MAPGREPFLLLLLLYPHQSTHRAGNPQRKDRAGRWGCQCPIPQHPKSSGPSSVTLGTLQNPARLQQREGLGIRFVVSEGNPSPLGYFPTLLCSYKPTSSSPRSRRARRWEQGGFRAGIWGRGPSAARRALPALPSPGLRAAGRRELEQPSVSGTLPFVSENKVSAVTQPVAIPAIPASTSARQREAFLPAAARSNAHGGMDAAGVPRGGRPTPALAPTGMVFMVLGFTSAFWGIAVAPRGRNVLILICFVVVAAGSLDTGWCPVCIPKEPVSSTGHR